MSRRTPEEIRDDVGFAVKMGADPEVIRSIVEELKVANREEEAKYSLDQGRQAVVDSMTTSDRTLSGIGRGMVNAGLKTREALGVVPGFGGIRPSPESMYDVGPGSAKLLDTTAGSVGNFVGESAATAPLGMGVGKGAQLLGRALGPRAAALLPAAGQLVNKAGGGAAPNLGRFLQSGFGQGVTGAGAQGYLMSRPEERGSGAFQSAISAGLLGGAGKLVRGAYRGYAHPSGASQLLEKAGVEGLTVGQMNPSSALGQMEHASLKIPVWGSYLKGIQGKAERSFERQAMKHSLTDGTDLQFAGPTGNQPGSHARTMLGLAYDDFPRAYAPFKGHPIVGAVTTADLEKIGLDSTLLGIPVGSVLPIDKAALVMVRESAPDFGLSPNHPAAINVASKVSQVFRNLAVTRKSPPTGQPGPGQIFDSADILSARSSIREVARDLGEDNYGKAAGKLYSKVDDLLTQVLDRDIQDPAMKGALKKVDTAYHSWNVLKGAINRNKSPDAPVGFSGSNLETAAGLEADSKLTAMGRAGPLHNLGRAAKNSFENKPPMTGASYMLIPAGMITAPFSGSQTARKLLTGRTGPQQMAQQMEIALRRAVGPNVRREVKNMSPLVLGGMGARAASGEGNLVRDERLRASMSEEERMQMEALLRELRQGGYR